MSNSKNLHDVVCLNDLRIKPLRSGFQVQTPLALVLVLLCEPVFAFNSTWFPTEADYRNTFLSLLLFMVVSFSMAYLGKLVRTAGNDV